jgi:hypothetical protein
VMKNRRWKELTTEDREWIFKMNECLRPWSIAFLGLSTKKMHQKMYSTWSNNNVLKDIKDGMGVIYIKYNLKNNDTYTGKTKHYKKRFYAHMKSTWEHNYDEPSTNKEYKKYKQMGKIDAIYWLTIPMFNAQGKDVSRIENWMIHYLNTNLNQDVFAKPWVQAKRVNVDSDCIKKNIRDRRNFLLRESKKWKGYRCHTNLTKYECDGRIWFDILPLLKKCEEGKLLKIKVVCGTVDLTQWYKIKKLLTYSYAKIDDKEISTLKEVDTNMLHGKYAGMRRDLCIIIRKSDYKLITEGYWITPENAQEIEYETKPIKYNIPRGDAGNKNKDYRNNNAIQEIPKYWITPEKTVIGIFVPAGKDNMITFLGKVSDYELHEVWKNRRILNKYLSSNYGNYIWEECELRYAGFNRKPICLRIPKLLPLNGGKLREQIRQLLTTYSTWPEYLIEWHIRNMRFYRTSFPNFHDILINVNKHWRPTGICACDALKRKLKKYKSVWEPDKIDGHFFCIGRDYKGPFEGIMKYTNTNIPTIKRQDKISQWKRILSSLPINIPISEMASLVRKMDIGFQSRHDMKWPTTRDAYRLKKLLDGMVIAPIDKNIGEFSISCPIIYEKALKKAYTIGDGYEQVWIRKHTPYQVKKMGKDKIHKYVLNNEHKGKKRQSGDREDVIKAWKGIYKAKGWQRFGKFDDNGDINKPYILFKSKNVTSKDIRKEKWAKARPITPQTKHPMRIMYGKAGRAWYFIATNAEIGGLTIPNLQDIPEFLRQSSSEIRKEYGTLKTKLYDIEGCFSFMPHNAIKIAVTEIVSQLKRKGFSGVWVPRSKKNPCTWKQKDRNMKRKTGTWMPLEELKDILIFALDNTYIKMDEDTVLRQTLGIPMGNALSPGICILTCAWMEKEWMASIDKETLERVRGARYMDDILLIYSNEIKEKEFLESIKNHCYWEPLVLTECQTDTFLENKFFITKNSEIGFRLKNDNEETLKIWRYNHYSSGMDYQTKRKVISAMLHKVHHHASDEAQLKISAKAKLKEFELLEYPKGILRYLCKEVGFQTGDNTWYEISRTI